MCQEGAGGAGVASVCKIAAETSAETDVPRKKLASDPPEDFFRVNLLVLKIQSCKRVVSIGMTNQVNIPTINILLIIKLTNGPNPNSG